MIFPRVEAVALDIGAAGRRKTSPEKQENNRSRFVATLGLGKHDAASKQVRIRQLTA
jgi:hypothetical protein